MKDYTDLLDLEALILDKKFKAKKELWGGAGMTVILPSDGPKEDGLVTHKDAYEISTLIFELKDIIPYDYLDKYELFGNLLTDLPENDPCVEIINRAKKIYLERASHKLRLV